MAFQSYCWSLGTTSFRVQNLNYKIERQLQLLNVLWSDKSNIGWDEITQEKYYNIMHEAGLLIGEAQRKSKDARQKTSGLVEIGVIDKDRKITNIGNKIIPDKILLMPIFSPFFLYYFPPNFLFLASKVFIAFKKSSSEKSGQYLSINKNSV